MPSPTVAQRKSRCLGGSFQGRALAVLLVVALVGTLAASAHVARAQDATPAGGSDANKALVLRYYEEVWNGGDTAVAHEVLASDFTWRLGLNRVFLVGPDAVMQHADNLRSQIEGLGLTVDAILAEGDLVAARWTLTATPAGANGTPAATTVLCTGNDVWRIEGGLAAEVWAESASCET
jgi:hypothetical protein